MWLGGRGPKALERVGRIADGWLGAQLTPPRRGLPASRSRTRPGRPAGRSTPSTSASASRTHGPRPLPNGSEEVSGDEPISTHSRYCRSAPTELRTFISGYIEAGLSKFVIRPFDVVLSSTEEAQWLSEAILDLQT